MSLSNQNYKWTIIFLFLGLVVVPFQLPSPTLKMGASIVFGGACIFFEFLSLKSLKAGDENLKGKTLQTIFLIVLTGILLVLNLFI